MGRCALLTFKLYLSRKNVKKLNFGYFKRQLAALFHWMLPFQWETEREGGKEGGSRKRGKREQGRENLVSAYQVLPSFPVLMKKLLLYLGIWGFFFFFNLTRRFHLVLGIKHTQTLFSTSSLKEEAGCYVLILECCLHVSKSCNSSVVGTSSVDDIWAPDKIVRNVCIEEE